MSNNNSNTFTASGISQLNDLIFDIGDSGGTNNSGTITNTANQLNNGGWDNIFDDQDEEDGEGGYGSGGYGQRDNAFTDFSTRDSIIFLIDCSAQMFVPHPTTKEIPFYNAIKCVIQTIQDKIITSDSDLIGLCLFGSEKNKNVNDFENIFVLFDLDYPDPKSILLLEEIISGDTSMFGGSSTKEYAFGDALWTCSSMFSNCNIKVTSKRIFLFTNQDNPNENNDNLRNTSYQRAKDLSDLGISIELFAMNRSDQDPFDFTLYYQNIVFFQDDDYIDKIDATSKFEALRSKLKRKEFKKRSLGKIPLYIGGNNQNNNNVSITPIACQLYNLVSHATKSSPTQLDPSTNLPVKYLLKNICSDTGSTLLPSQIKQCYYYGGEPVIFKKEEIDRIKTCTDRQGLVLLGFKPKKDAIKDHQVIKHCAFLFPDEKSIKGSTVTFNALLEKMLEKGKVAICKFLARSNAAPRIVALIPQEEVLDTSNNHSGGANVQLIPRGFHIVYLPYADDIRNFQLTSTHTANENQIDLAKKVVKALKIPFDNRDYLNPALQKHYSNLQALALERDNVDEIKDNAKPDEILFNEHIDEIKAFEESVYPKDYLKNLADSNKKREREGKSLGDLDWNGMAKSGGIAKLTIPEISSFLKNQGQKTPSKSKKADLVEIATNFVLSGKIDQTKLNLLKTTPTDSNTTGSTTLYHKDDDEEENHRPKKKVKNQHKYSNTTTTTSSGSSNSNSQQSNSQTSTSSTTTTTTTSTRPKPPADKDDDFLMKPVDSDDDDDDYNNQSVYNNQNNRNNNNSAVGSSFINAIRGASTSNQQQSTSSTSSTSPSVSRSTSASGDQFVNTIRSNSSINQQSSSQGSQQSLPASQPSYHSASSNTSGHVNTSSLQYGYQATHTDTRPLCKYDGRCYRKNRDHFDEFKHVITQEPK